MKKADTARGQLIDLLECCPVGSSPTSNPRRCPLHEIRLQSPDDRVAWVMSLEPLAVARALEYHVWCRARRELLAAPLARTPLAAL